MDIKEIVNNFPNARISVVGDVMLDHYIYGDVERISPEAPVPVLKSNREVYGLGGAANVAANISFLGGEVILFGYVGKDKNAEILLEKSKEKNIKCNLLPILSETTKKTRVIGNKQQQIVRIDNEGYVQDSLDEGGLAYNVYERNPEVVIISDYAKGVLSKNFFQEILKFGVGSKIIVDPKPASGVDYTGAYLITPNLKEAREMTGLKDVNEIGKELQKKFKSNILITKGRDGMTLFYEDKIFNIPAEAKEVYDVAGAGDTVIGTIGLCLGSGCSLKDSVVLANHAAGIVVGKKGVAIVSKNELKQVIDKEYSKIKELKELKELREDYKGKGRKVIWTNGCFDIFHAGHLDYLKKAGKLGDCLIVGVNGDESVKRLKGEDRPVHEEQHRAEILSSLECVDYVVIFNELTPENCLKELKPDVYVKAGDYEIDTINQDERKIVEDCGGEISIIPVVHEVSTTKIIEKIRNGG